MNDFGYSGERDEEAARILNRFVKRPDLESLKRMINGRQVAVLGAGPSLEEVSEIPEDTKIAADGATSFLLEKKVLPDIIVTDLDGRIEDLITANERGSIVIIHAHGDNIALIEEYAGDFKKVIGTTQSKPFGNLSNFGGFTDGDRAVFLAEHFGAEEIVLYGMDFNKKAGRYSFTPNSEIKRKKLSWAERLISYLMENGSANIRFSEGK